MHRATHQVKLPTTVTLQRAAWLGRIHNTVHSTRGVVYGCVPSLSTPVRSGQSVPAALIDQNGSAAAV